MCVSVNTLFIHDLRHRRFENTTTCRLICLNEKKFNASNFVLIFSYIRYLLGRLSVLSTQTNNSVSSIQMKEAGDINLANLKDLAPIG